MARLYATEQEVRTPNYRKERIRQKKKKKTLPQSKEK